jgi:hypothetical protein
MYIRAVDGHEAWRPPASRGNPHAGDFNPAPAGDHALNARRREPGVDQLDQERSLARRSGGSRSATFNRFKASSKATVMAAVSSGPNAVLISRRVIGISLTYGCESQKLLGCQQGSAS